MMLEHEGQVGPVAFRALRQGDLRHVPRLATSIEPPHHHRRRQRLDADDPEAQAVEHLKDLLQRRPQLGEVEQPLELLLIHADEVRGLLALEAEPVDPPPHLTQKF